MFLFLGTFLSAALALVGSEPSVHLGLQANSWPAEDGTWSVFEKEEFQLNVKLQCEDPLRYARLRLFLPVAAQWTFEPLLNSYQISNTKELDDIRVESNQASGIVQFDVHYSNESASSQLSVTIPLRATGIKVGDVRTITCRVSSNEFPSASSKLTVKCVEPNVLITTQKRVGNVGVRSDGAIDSRDEWRRRILKRNVRAVTESIELQKQIEVVDTTASPDRFRVTVLGIPVASNTTIYDLKIFESTAGLDSNVQYVIPSSTDQLISADNTITYSKGNYTAREGNFTFVYETTLSNNGADIEDTHDILTTVQYYTSPQMITRMTVNATACISKNIDLQEQSCVWCLVLIIIGCLILGFFLAFLAFFLTLCIPKSSLIEPSPQKLKTESGKVWNGEKRYEPGSNMMEVLLKTNQYEMYNDIERIELERLMTLHQNIEEERLYMQRLIAAAPDAQTRDGKRKDLRSYSKKGDNGKSVHLHDKEMKTKCGTDLKTLKIRHKDEMEDVRKRIKHGSQKFQENMIALVEKRHGCDVTDVSFLEVLQQHVQDYDETYSNVATRESSMPNTSTDDAPNSINEAAYLENVLCHKLIDIFCKNIFLIQKDTKARDEMVTSLLRRRENEKKLWNKMVSQQLELTKMACREQMISVSDKEALCENTISLMKSAKATYVTEEKRRQFQLLDQYQATAERLHRSRKLPSRNDVKNSSSTSVWLQELLDNFQACVDAENAIEKQSSDSAYQALCQFLDTVTSQLRQSIEDARKQLQAALIENGVDKTWLSNVMSEQDQELKKFWRALEMANATLPWPVSRKSFAVGDVDVRSLQQICTSQPFATKEKGNIWNAENKLLNDICTRGLRHYISGRLSSCRRIIEEKQEAIEKITTGYDEVEIERELQAKADIGEKMESVDKLFINETKVQNRLFLSQSRQDAQEALADILHRSTASVKELNALERDRRAIEDLMMTILKCMASAQEMTSDDCKRVLQEYKAQAEATKHKFSAEMKRQVELLKRKTERSIQLKNNSLVSAEVKHDGKGLSEIAEYSKGIENAAGIRMKEERETMQELHATTYAVITSQMKTSLEQEIMFVSGLTKAVGISSDDITVALEFLMPEKSKDYITKLSFVLTGNEERKRSVERKSQQLFLPFVRELEKKQSHAADQKDSFSSGRLLDVDLAQRTRELNPMMADPNSLTWSSGVRPEPLGRTASPKAEDQWNRFDHENETRNGAKRKLKRKKKSLAALKKHAQAKSLNS